MTITYENVLDVLREVKVSGEQDLVSLGMVDGLKIENGDVFFAIRISMGSQEAMEHVRKLAEKSVASLPGAGRVIAILTSQRAPEKKTETGEHFKEIKAPEGVRHVIAVTSGKGGVGKSTVAANLALALAAQGLKVGLMDADVYGPSVPRLMGITGRGPESGEGEKIRPLEVYGIKVMSMGFLVNEDMPVIWRGPMVARAVNQFLYDVDWGRLDVLVVDMPPGTGDAQLTLAQRVPLSGAVIVSTPQDIALVDARKGLEMFRKVGVQILGMVENMSLFVCPKCGYESHIFGHGGARVQAEKLDCEFLGAIPLNMQIRQTSDLGTPVVVADPDSDYAAIFRQMAIRIIDRLEEV